MFNACVATPPQSPAEGLPSFGLEDASLLDDSFSGHLFETAFVPGVAGDDPRFNDRVARAQYIWLVKVATVSREGSLNESRHYSLSLRAMESLSGPLPLAPISLTIYSKDPAFHWLDRVGGAWVGKELWLMTRNYRRGPGERSARLEPPESAVASQERGPSGPESNAGGAIVMHFHGEPNTPELRARIRRIRQALAK